MSKPFLVINHSVLTYDDLVNALNKTDSYFPYYKTSNLANYWINFVKALICSMPVTLIDSDLQDTELENFTIKQKLETSHECASPNITTTSGLLRYISQSESEITIFTSGTTGQPKSVVHSVKSLTRSVKIGEKHRGNIWGFAYNPTHIAGIQVFFQALLNENTIVNLFGLSRDEIFAAIQKHRITHISATPTFYRLLMPPVFSLPEIERATLGGEKSSPELISSIKQLFPNAKVTNVYASTEAGTLFASHGDVFSVKEEHRQYVKFDNDELLIHKTFLGKSDDFFLENDFYRTGDLIEWIDDSHSTFRFKSRKNELINVGGYKVNPFEVEESIHAFPEVAAVKVYGKPNSVLGNILCADIVLKKGQSLSENLLRLELKKSLQEFKIPRKIIFVDNVELTRTGKLKR